MKLSLPVLILTTAALNDDADNELLNDRPATLVSRLLHRQVSSQIRMSRDVLYEPDDRLDKRIAFCYFK